MDLRAQPAADARSAVGLMIESFVRQQRYLPDGARPIGCATDLPPRLQVHARDRGLVTAWRAWAEGARLWFVIGRLSGSYGEASDLLCLEVLFFGADGEAVAAGAWALQPDGGSALRRVIEPTAFWQRTEASGRWLSPAGPGGSDRPAPRGALVKLAI